MQVSQERENQQTAVAAMACLNTHLSNGRKHSKLIAKNKDIAKHIHDFRVAARRSMTCMDVFASFLNDDFYRDTRRSLNALRKRCGKVRDRQIFLKCLADMSPLFTESELIAGFYVAREARKQLERKTKKLRRTFAKRRTQRTWKRIGKHFDDPKTLPATTGKLSDFAPMVISKEIREIYKLYEQASQDESFATIHKLRRQFKRLRYTIEAFEEQLRRPSIQALHEILVEAQDILGRLADYDMSLKMLQLLGQKHQTAKHDTDVGLALLSERISMRLEREHELFTQFWDEKIAVDYGYEMLKAWGLRETTARWVLGKAKVVKLPRPKIERRQSKRSAVSLGR